MASYDSDSRLLTRCAICVIAFVVAAVVTLAVPASAFAAYSNPSVNTVAQVRTDGSLHVAEQRAFAFDEDYSMLTWEFTGLDDKQTVAIDAVRAASIGDDGAITQDWQTLVEVSFQPAWRDFVWDTEGVTSRVEAAVAAYERAGADTSDGVALPDAGTYALDKRSHKLYIFLAPTHVNTVVECDYLIDNAALVYDDVAEIYWDYVAAKQDIVTDDVHVQIQLPVPEGALVVPGETIMAWGHGSAGTIDIKADGTIDYAVEEVDSSQYAQAHVIFPAKWLTNLSVQKILAKNGLRAESARAEEAAWVDSFSAARINGLSVDIAVAVLCILAIAGSAVVYLAFGRELQPQIDEEGTVACAADVSDGLEGYDAAAIGRLIRWNHHSADDFVATVQQLIRKGVITVDAAGDATRLRVTPAAKKVKLLPTEQEAMEFVFDMVGDGYQSVSLAEIRSFCASHAAEAKAAISGWQQTLTHEVTTLGLFDVRSYKAAKWLGILAVVLMALAVYLWGASWLRGVMLLLSAVLVGVVAYHVPRRTQLGSDVAALAARGSWPGWDSGKGDARHLSPREDALSDNREGDWRSGLSGIIEDVMASDVAVSTAASSAKVSKGRKLIWRRRKKTI